MCCFLMLLKETIHFKLWRSISKVMHCTLVKYFNNYSVIYMLSEKHLKTAQEALTEQKLKSIT